MSNEILTTAMQPALSGNGKKSWFEAMAEAWGRALDTQAERIRVKSEEVANAEDTTDVNQATFRLLTTTSPRTRRRTSPN